MLEFIRERAQGWLAWAIILFICIPFAFWGLDQYMNPETTVNVAVVDGQQIGQAEFQDMYQQQRQRIQQMLGANFDPAMIDENRMKQDVLDGLIGRAALLSTAEKAGMRVSDAQVANEILAIPELQKDGRFDNDTYQRLLRQRGQSVKQFEADLRKDILIGQISRGIADTDFVTRRESDALTRLTAQRRDAGYMILPVAAYSQQVVIDEAAVKRYYDEHQSRYITPEQVSVDYLELNVAGMERDVPVTEEALRERYQEHMSDFATGEERRARHILIQASADAPAAEAEAARKKALDLLARLRKGESFEELARKYSQDPGSAQSGGDLGYFGRGIMDKAFETAAFALKAGEISEPVRSGFGFHIIKLEDIKGGGGKSFEEARAQVERDYRRQKAEEAFYDQLDHLSNLTFENPDTLKVAAESLKFPVKSSALFTREGGPGIAANPKVRNAAFSDDVLIGGRNSEAVELAPDHVIVLRIKEHKASQARPLDEVREDISVQLRVDAAKEKAKEAGQSFIKRMRQGEEAAAVAKQAKLEWKRLTSIGREEGATDRAIVEGVFRAPRPEKDKPGFDGVALPSGDYAVVAVFSVREGDLSAQPATVLEQMIKTVMRDRVDTEIKAYIDTLKKQVEVVKHPENM